MGYLAQVIVDYAGTLPIPEPIIVPTPIHQDRFDIDNRAELAAVVTTNLVVGTVFNLITGTGSSRTACVVELQAGTGAVGDTSVVIPNDYNATTNNKHWQVVLGYLP